MTPISLVATGAYLPPACRENDFFAESEVGSSPMFRGAVRRRHMGPEENSVTMVQRAVDDLVTRLDAAAIANVDILLTNVSLPDEPFTGSGAAIAHVVGCRPKRIIDLHNTGCVAFVAMLELARDLMAAGVGKTALLCCAQTAAGRVFGHAGNRHRPQSAIPGDGCGVGYVVANDSAPVRAIVTRAYGEYATDMHSTNDDGTPWYAPRQAPLYLDFDETRMARIVSRGNQLVPSMVSEACKLAGIQAPDIDYLVTNQPSPIFLRNWREALQVPPERQVQSFAEYGNLFGAAIPVNLAHASARGLFAGPSTVALGGFAHAGDYAAAAIWQTH